MHRARGSACLRACLAQGPYRLLLALLLQRYKVMPYGLLDTAGHAVPHAQECAVVTCSSAGCSAELAPAQDSIRDMKRGFLNLLCLENLLEIVQELCMLGNIGF